MAKLPFIPLLAIAIGSSAHAQSGRKTHAVPTPTPIAASDATVDYSESKSRTERSEKLTPSLRNVSGHSTKATPENQTNDGTGAKADIEGGEDILKVDTNLVTIPVSVFDRNGLYIPNLRQSDFKIFQDGKEQEIAYFGTADKPFTVILLLDTSPSTEYKINEIRRAAIAFVDQLKAEDRVMVIEFDGNVHVLTEATGDRQKIYKAIDRADFGFGTSLYDAVHFSLSKRLSKIEGRKAVVLFTDGVDTTSSKAGYDTTLSMAEEADALIFPIYYNTFSYNSGGNSPFPGRVVNPIGTRPQDYALGKKYLDELADYTGGRVFRPEATPGGLTAAFEGIAEELRRQYNIGYVPTEAGTAGQRKQIKVRVNRPNLVLRARDSYVVGASRKPSGS
ncbi:MAG: VWA domain-containing protein [Pyrinomonadaceae bacterium]